MHWIPLLLTSWTFLHYNENNWGPSAKVQEAMKEALQDANRYPDDDQEAFLKKLADFHSVNEDQLLISSGLLSSLRNIAETFVGEGKSLVTPSPSYEYLNLFAKNRNTRIIKIPLRSDDYAHDLDKMLEAIDETTTLVYICNPNNPTASITPREEIDRFLARIPPHVHVFIDEAYHHYAVGAEGYLSYLDKPSDNEKVMVGRTFSKAYGLAALRLGYVVGSQKAIAQLQKNDAYDQNNIPALRAAMAALKDEEGLQEAILRNQEAREEFYRQLQLRGLQWIPSHANFVMMETGGRRVEELIAHFNKHQIRVGRKFMDSHIRITLGLPHEMERFWKAWDLLDNRL